MRSNTKRPTNIPPRKRHLLLKKYDFKCVNCGRSNDEVPLEIDHIIPVIKGGTNDDYNLITACFDCNRGKGKHSLENSMPTQDEQIERLKEAHSQYKIYLKFLKDTAKQQTQTVQMVCDVYEEIYYGETFTPKFRISIKQFIDKLGVDEVILAMEKSIQKCYRQSDVPKYFCGICWNKIKGN